MLRGGPTEEEKEAGQEPVMGKYWSRNQSLRTLDFTGNRVSDRAVIDAMQPYSAHGLSFFALRFSHSTLLERTIR